MDKVDMLFILTLALLVWYRPLFRRTRKNPNNDLRIDDDRTRELVMANRTIPDDPLFFQRRI